jgi:hypothetical protein
LWRDQTAGTVPLLKTIQYIQDANFIRLEIPATSQKEPDYKEQEEEGRKLKQES